MAHVSTSEIGDAIVPALAAQRRERKMHLIHQALANISLTGIYAIMVVLFLAAAELGAWLGRRLRARGDEDKDASTLATAAMGLLALLIAFTYSIALERYDLRRQVVLEDANAIGSAANFALVLPADQRAPMLDMLRQYTRVRIALGAPFDPRKFEHDVAMTTELQGKMWQLAMKAAAAAPQSLPVYEFTSNLNEVNNVGEKRLTALRNHTPTVVIFALVATALIAIGFTGYASGLGGSRRRVGMILLSLLLAVLILLTIDLDRPNRGTIEVSTKALSDALAAIPASP